MIIISSKHIKAEDGYDLIRTFDNENFGSEAFLGTSVRDGVMVEDTPSDFHEEEHKDDEGGDTPVEE